MKHKFLTRSTSMTYHVLTMFFLLAGLGLTQEVKAWSTSANCLYFDNSVCQWKQPNVYFYTEGSGAWTYEPSLKQVSGTNYWVCESKCDNYKGFILKKKDSWDGQSCNFYESVSSPICYGWNGTNWTTKMAVGVKDVTLTNTTTVKGGSGTEQDPYIVAIGEKVTVSMSCTKIASSNHSRQYAFNEGSFSSTDTYTVVESVEIGGEYVVSGKARACLSNDNSIVSREFEADKTIYYKAEPAYEIHVQTEDDAKGTVDPSSINAYQYYQAENNITATAKVGYDFDYWDATDGVTVNSPSSASTTIKASKAGTLTAHFKAVTTYLIRFLNDDSSVLQEKEVIENTLPTYDGATPTKTETAEYRYTFKEWTPTIAVATQAQDYTATYTSIQKYAVSYCLENYFTFTNKSTTGAVAGETVSFSISINEGCKLNSVTILDAKQGNPVKDANLQHDGNGNYTFTMPAEAVSVSVSAAEDLTTGFKIKSTFDSWAEHALAKKTGHATEKIGYYTYTLAANTTYEFGIVRSSDNYFYKNGGTYTAANNGQWWTFPKSDNLNNCKIKTAVAGEYTFAVDYSEDTQGTAKIKVQITYPTEKFYEVTVTDNVGTDVKSIGDVNPVVITAADKEDWKFTNWTIDPSANIHFSEGSATTKTISITATGAATITANYEELPKVYFDNTVGWSNVYVYFNAYWDSEGKGAGAKGQPYGQMKQIGETNRYYYAYDVASPSAKIAFSSYDMHNYDNFNGYHAVYRGDFNTCRPVFTPDASAETKTYNNTVYNNTGYWQTLDTHTGMYFVYGLGNDDPTWAVSDEREFLREEASATRGVMTINLTEGNTYMFKIKTCAGDHYSNEGKITTNISLESSGWEFNTGKNNCEIVANKSGAYTFYYDFYSRRLWVLYPAYYLKHPWGEGENPWIWKYCDIYNEDGKTYSLYANYMGAGVNYNTKAENVEGQYCSVENGKLTLIGEPQVGKPARFTFNPQTNTATIENMYFPVTMNKYGYATLYHKENLQIPDGVTAKYVTGTEGVFLTYQEVAGGVIPKQTGVMLFAQANSLMEFEGVNEANETAPENIMGGTLANETINNTNIHYVLSTTAAGQVGMLWPKNTNEGVGSFTNTANKAYVELPGESEQSAPVRARGGYLFTNDINTPTELIDVNANANVNGKVLRNGQLIIIRDGKMFNAQGMAQ